ncbi:deoxyribodipyrimidine photo-lyase [Erwinia sp. HR93]|uniref:deoxyribodipyrimidine photo-lyase n=1 Tax=Erwinia sp. HR93 TaxID=3094840 RepID=UPI002ADEDE67|nr:deoxyribodipyrimidine photo-lyase [Erwinia sp. HR93]MEA1064442.1 deoxyribodipyrimidine photo-lyase [Erwinia sp. HR93]
MAATRLVWFRQDLRIHDNNALASACRDKNARVIALFLVTPEQWCQHTMAPRQAWFIREHVKLLAASLAEMGIPFFIEEVSDYAACIPFLQDFCRNHQVNELFYHYQYALNELHRDAAVEKALGKDVICQGFDDGVILAPGSVTTGNGSMYKVFTPFSRACLRRLQEDIPACAAVPNPRGDGIPITHTPRFTYPVTALDRELFPPGEEEALKRLKAFCQEDVVKYDDYRDFPAIRGTSLLSPWLSIGALSPRQCLWQLLAKYPDALSGGEGFVWLKELLWRDFYRHTMVAHPEICRGEPLLGWTKSISWRHDPGGLKAWQQGMTGFPIVDAAMRQLNTLGWMHNRLRMIVASFLVKDLRIDWREGERYFISQLADGDFASNNGGWQWAASTGTDAQPWFRIFNPTTQGQKFDAKGDFIRRWIPELNEIPDNALHAPHEWARQHNKTLDYPGPIVDHRQQRELTLAAWQRARKRTQRNEK